MSTELLSILAKYLDSYNWKYEFEESAILVRFMGEESGAEFRMIIKASEYWVGFTIWPFVFQFPKDKANEALLYLCKRNFETKLVRLGLTEKGAKSFR